MSAETDGKKDFRKDNATKSLMGCLPPKALAATARVLTFGAKKYGRDNWHKAPAFSTYYDALLRHLNAWWGGEDLDPDTGQSHLAHATCCVLFLLEFVERPLVPVNDDRPMVPENPELVKLRARVAELDKELFALKMGK